MAHEKSRIPANLSMALRHAKGARGNSSMANFFLSPAFLKKSEATWYLAFLGA